MRSKPEQSAIRDIYLNAEDTLNAARSVGERIRSLATALSDASKTAVGLTYPDFPDDSELAEVWPLADDLSVFNLYAGKASMSIDQERKILIGTNVDTAQSRFSQDLLNSSKYDDELLEEVYGDDDARSKFVGHLLRWTNAMAQTGWPLLLQVCLPESNRIEVRVFEDTEGTREYLKSYTDGSLADPEEGPYKSDVWLTDRVLVDGTSEITSRLVDGKWASFVGHELLDPSIRVGKGVVHIEAQRAGDIEAKKH